MDLYFSYRTARTRRLRFVTLARHTGDGSRRWLDLSMLEYFRDTLKNYNLHTGKTQIRLYRPPSIEGDVLVLHSTEIGGDERWDFDGKMS